MKWWLLFISWTETGKKKFLTDKHTIHELLNWISHALGVVFVIPAGVWLLYVTWQYQSWSGVLAVLIFVLSFLLLYLSSSLYHYLVNHRKRTLFRKLDHISIFVMIAGTYTPFLVISLDNFVGKLYLAILWLFVVFGIVYKLFLMGKYRWVSLLLYLFMGYILIFNFEAFQQALPRLSLQWILIGGAFYTLGVIFYIWKRLPYHHFIWHLFVFGGSLSHFAAVYYSVVL